MNKILVIDHDEAFRKTLATALEQQGFEVLQAATGVQGVQTARTELPNLILCDVDLQGLGGNLILFAVRRDPQLTSIPFVLMSRSAVTEVSPQGIDKGADAFLAKPFSTAALTSTIDECLTRRDAPSPRFEIETDEAPAGESGPDSWKVILDALQPVVEATRIISTAYHQLERKEIAGLATQAHQAAAQLYQKVESWLPALEGAGCR
jgi:CheY-like chemotaxis protein